MIEHVEVQLICHFLGLNNPIYIKSCPPIQGRQKQLVQSGQKATIRYALPEEFKEELKQELGKEVNKARYRSGSEKPQNLLLLTKTVTFSEIRISPILAPLARVITESERIKKIEHRLNEASKGGTLTPKTGKRGVKHHN
jgi:hypothetical protein